ncbi:unnamed protein product [Rotaria sp. Silwood1]|nr:unnamed protein product [Rotaria sp. Silwood1]
MMMTSNHPSPVRDFIRVNFGPICTSTGIQLSNMIRGKGTGAEVAGLSGTNGNEKDAVVTLFIIEHVILPNHALSNWQSHAFDLVMAMSLDDARERTQNEHEQLLNKSGFKLIQIYLIQSPDSIIDAVIVHLLKNLKSSL